MQGRICEEKFLLQTLVFVPVMCKMVAVMQQLFTIMQNSTRSLLLLWEVWTDIACKISQNFLFEPLAPLYLKIILPMSVNFQKRMRGRSWPFTPSVVLMRLSSTTKGLLIDPSECSFNLFKTLFSEWKVLAGRAFIPISSISSQA